MGVEIDITYLGDLHCEAIHLPSGTVLTTDAPVDNGGRGALFSPTDLVAAGFGTCILTILGIVAQRRGFALTGTRVHVVKEMVSEPVRRIGRLTAHITLPAGLSLTAEDRINLERGAQHCPVKQSLHPDVVLEITFDYPQ